MISAVAAGVVMLAGVSTQAQTGRRSVPIAVEDLVPGLRGFSVVLVQGDLKAGGSSDSVPAAAAKALADLKDFLPYKAYRLLDTQWTMGSGHMAGKLRGPEAKDYDLELTTQKGSTADAPVTISRFTLRDAGTGPWTLFENGLVSQSKAQAGQAATTGRARVFPLAPARTIIDTTFSMKIGETVVVGTSRLQGDTALIVLLTAVSRDTSAR